MEVADSKIGFNMYEAMQYPNEDYSLLDLQDLHTTCLQPNEDIDASSVFVEESRIVDYQGLEKSLDLSSLFSIKHLEK